jgi:hypothetical protein
MSILEVLWTFVLVSYLLSGDQFTQDVFFLLHHLAMAVKVVANKPPIQPIPCTPIPLIVQNLRLIKCLSRFCIELRQKVILFRILSLVFSEVKLFDSLIHPVENAGFTCGPFIILDQFIPGSAACLLPVSTLGKVA